MKTRRVIWYLSKYAMSPNDANVGHRGHYLIKGLQDLGDTVYIINSNSYNKIRKRTLKKIYNFRNLDKVKYLTINTTHYKKSFSFKRIWSWIEFEIKLFAAPLNKLKNPDYIIVSSLSLLTIINGILIKLRYNCKLIFEIRDIWPLSLMEYKGYKKYNPIIIFLRIIEFFGYLFSDKIIGTMPLLSMHVKSIIGDDSKVNTIPIGFSLKQKQFNNKIKDKTINDFLNDKKITITYIGSIGLSNNLDSFFEVIKNLEKNKKVNFLIIGDGELKDKYINKYGYLENVAICNPIKKKYVNNVLSRSDILYLSLSKNKIWDYGQSLNKMVDYMLSARPIVASYSGYKTMINESNCGEFVEVDNVLELEKKLIKFSKLSKNERNEIGMKGKQWLYKNRSYDKLAKKYSKIIDSI